MPANVEAERIILGSVLMVPGVFRSVRSALRPSQLYLVSHAEIYRAFNALFEANREIDFVTVQDVLSARGQLDFVGGPAYLGSLIDGVPRLSNLDEYIQIVVEKSRLRQLIQFTNNLQQRAYASEAPGDLVDAMAAWCKKNASATDSSLVFNRDLADVVKDKLDRARENPDVTMGLRTGLDRFDYAINGIDKSQLVTVAGYSSLGKTALALQWLDSMTSRRATSGKRVVALYVTLEMSPEELFLRQVSQRVSLGGRTMLQGRYVSAMTPKIDEAIESLRGFEVAYIGSAERGAAEITNKLDRLQAIYGDAAEYVVFVDTLQLMVSGDEDDHRAVARASRENKQIASAYKVPIIQLSQITVPNTYDLSIEPHEGMLRGAKSIYHDSDLLVFLHAPTGNTNDPDRQLIKRKDRWGPRVEYFDLIYNGAATRFSEIV